MADDKNKVKEELKKQIAHFELVDNGSSNTPKRKKKLLVHYSNISLRSPTFRELFAYDKQPIAKKDESIKVPSNTGKP